MYVYCIHKIIFVNIDKQDPYINQQNHNHSIFYKRIPQAYNYVRTNMVLFGEKNNDFLLNGQEFLQHSHKDTGKK